MPSPLRIPLPTDELLGRSFESGEADLRAGIALACGGDQCVSIERVGEGTVLDEGADCDTIVRVQDTDVAVDEDGEPRPYVAADRGGTVTVVVNVRCEDVPSPSTTPDEPGESGEQGESTAPGGP